MLVFFCILSNIHRLYTTSCPVQWKHCVKRASVHSQSTFNHLTSKYHSFADSLHNTD